MQADTVDCASIGCWSKRGSFAAAGIEAVGADGHEVAISGLFGDQPAQCLQTKFQCSMLMNATMTGAGDEGVGQLCIVVGQHRLETKASRRYSALRTG